MVGLGGPHDLGIEIWSGCVDGASLSHDVDDVFWTSFCDVCGGVCAHENYPYHPLRPSVVRHFRLFYGACGVCAYDCFYGGDDCSNVMVFLRRSRQRTRPLIQERHGWLQGLLGTVSKNFLDVLASRFVLIFYFLYYIFD